MGRAFSLEWLEGQVRGHNLAVKAARSEAEAARAMSRGSLALPDPQIGLEYWDIPRGSLDLGSAPERWLDVSQEIPFPGKLLLKSGVAGHESVLKAAETEGVLQGELFQARQAFWDDLAAWESARVLKEAAAGLESMASLLEGRARFGQAGRMDQVMQSMARMQATSLKNQVLDLEQRKLEAGITLRRMAGGGEEPSLGEPVAPPPGPLPREDDLLAVALQDRAEMHQALHHLWHLQAQRKLAQAGWAPDLMLQYSWIDRPEGPGASMAMAKVNLPFIWFWRQGAEASAAGKEVESAQAMLEDTQAETRQMVHQEWAALKTENQQYENLQATGLPQAGRAEKLAMSGFRAGSLNPADGLAAWKESLEMKLEAVALRAQIGRTEAWIQRLQGEPMTEVQP
jgi:outer membrane protein TolC